MGDTECQHDDFFMKIFLSQLLEYAIVVIENATRAFGSQLFSGVLGPILDHWLNHYKTSIKIKSWFEGQDTEDTFYLDYRNVRDP